MKKITTAILLLFACSAVADEHAEVCSMLSDVARKTMMLRQEYPDYAAHYSMMTDDFGRSMVTAAYAAPHWLDAGFQRMEAQRFADKAFGQCIKGGR